MVELSKEHQQFIASLRLKNRGEYQFSKVKAILLASKRWFGEEFCRWLAECFDPIPCGHEENDRYRFEIPEGLV